MGGVDNSNATGMILNALKQCPLPSDCRIVVIMGKTAPFLESVKSVSESLPWSTEVRIDVDDMAREMAESDLAIGAAGSTAWERCCLGLPSFLIVLAPNQAPSAKALHDQGSAHWLGYTDTISERLPAKLESWRPEDELPRMTANATTLTNGRGSRRLVHHLVGEA